jgi:hypothetical protein
MVFLLRPKMMSHVGTRLNVRTSSSSPYSAAGFTDNSNINVLPLPDGKTALSMTEAAQGTYLVSGGVCPRLHAWLCSLPVVPVVPCLAQHVLTGAHRGS